MLQMAFKTGFLIFQHQRIMKLCQVEKAGKSHEHNGVKLYQLLFSQERGTFCGYAHGYYFTDIKAKTPDGAEVLTPKTTLKIPFLQVL